MYVENPMWTYLKAFLAKRDGSVALDWAAFAGIVMLFGVTLLFSVERLQLSNLGYQVTKPTEALQLSPSRLQDGGFASRILAGRR